MFAYNPGVADRSGEILGEGANNAAMLTMRSMENFGENIGNALSDIADRYTERKELEAKASSYDDIGRIIGTVASGKYDGKELAFGALMGPAAKWFKII